MDVLIYSYHFAIIFIVMITFLCTIFSLAKIGSFKNVPQSTTKALTAALIIEIIAAFVGVYKTLPQLKMDVSEQYRFEITYDDLVDDWIKNLSEEDQALISPFVSDGGLRSYLRFLDDVEKYREIKNFSNLGGTPWIEYYSKFMRDEQKESSEIFLNVYGGSPNKVFRGFELMKEYARLKGSSKKAGNGRMWASISGDKMEGIVVYNFPDGIPIPTVLVFEGNKISKDGVNFLALNFTQQVSAVSAADVFYDRPGGAFRIELEEKDGAFIGNLKDVGSIKVEVWEL